VGEGEIKWKWDERPRGVWRVGGVAERREKGTDGHRGGWGG